MSYLFWVWNRNGGCAYFGNCLRFLFQPDISKGLGETFKLMWLIIHLEKLPKYVTSRVLVPGRKQVGIPQNGSFGFTVIVSLSDKDISLWFVKDRVCAKSFGIRLTNHICRSCTTWAVPRETGILIFFKFRLVFLFFFLFVCPGNALTLSLFILMCNQHLIFEPQSFNSCKAWAV